MTGRIICLNCAHRWAFVNRLVRCGNDKALAFRSVRGGLDTCPKHEAETKEREAVE